MEGNIKSFILAGNKTASQKYLTKCKKKDELWTKLLKILFKYIGPVNPILVKKYAKNDILSDLDLDKMIDLMCNSKKTNDCVKLAGIFCCKQLEPFPRLQLEMVDFMDDEYSLRKALRIMISLYWRGMDNVFWQIISQSSDFVAKMVPKLSKIQDIKTIPYVWIFSLLCCYFDFNDKIGPKNFSQEKNGFVKLFPNDDIFPQNGPKIYAFRPENHEQNSQYFRTGVENMDFLLPLDKLPTFQKYSAIHLRNTIDVSIKFDEIGLLQCQIVSNSERKDYALYCWLTNSDGKVEKYLIKYFSMKKLAHLAAKMDNLILCGDFVKNNKSEVICVRQYIENFCIIENEYKGNIKNKKMYCTLTKINPNQLPIKSLKDISHKLDEIQLIKYLKFIAGASQNDNDITINLNGEIGSVENNPIWHDKIKIYKKTEKLEKFLEWLNEQTDGGYSNDVFIRMRIILTAYGY